MLVVPYHKIAISIILALWSLLSTSNLYALEISNRYRSPRNPERKIRSSTRLIVLHTTEAPARSSLNKVSDRGECHFCVTENGSVYGIVDRDREAFHAGRSMWQGAEDVDKYSVGIECVGYHNKVMPKTQIAAIRELVKELKSHYKLPDHAVVAHSHVAYGAPNKWHRYKHRGRKRCGMLFAMPSVRCALGLKTRPAFDPDLKAKRLRCGDDYLHSVLYGRVDTMASAYFKPKQKKAANSQPKALVKPKTIVKQKTAVKPKAIVKASLPVEHNYKNVKTISKPKTVIKSVKFAQPRSIAELKNRGYKICGTVTKSNSASKIAGARWNAPDTYYTIRDKVISGAQLNEARIESGMSVWIKK